MQKILIIILLLYICSIMIAQDTVKATEKKVNHKFNYSGQVSAWGQFAPDIHMPLWIGGRYIPQINYDILFPYDRKIDFELSANIFGDLGIEPFSEIEGSGKIKPYRVWARYSTKQLEVRFGLQKINFGSAQMFRPLMWFDTMDPRDPLQLTDGVWGGLFRYYFKNNTNLWFWTLYGNKETKGWEIIKSSKSFPEFGGRAQLPIPKGEIAASYNFRKTDWSEFFPENSTHFNNISENKIGFDIRLDYFIGIWLEASWTNLNKSMGDLTNQEMLTIGGDYTFGIGNGLGLTFEQLLYSYDEKAFAFSNNTTFSGLMLTYPVSLFDDISTMLYYDWNNNNVYSFINWQHNFKHIALHLMLYWNPNNILLPGQMGSNRFLGKGAQIMLVWNH